MVQLIIFLLKEGILRSFKGYEVVVLKKKGSKTSLVQLVERRFPKPNVVGSSPTGRVQQKN